MQKKWAGFVCLRRRDSANLGFSLPEGREPGSGASDSLSYSPAICMVTVQLVKLLRPTSAYLYS